MGDTNGRVLSIGIGSGCCLGGSDGIALLQATERVVGKTKGTLPPLGVQYMKMRRGNLVDIRFGKKKRRNIRKKIVNPFPSLLFIESHHQIIL